MWLVEILELTLGVLCPESVKYKLFNTYEEAQEEFYKLKHEIVEEMNKHFQTWEDKIDMDDSEIEHQNFCVSCNDIEWGYQVRLEKVKVQNE